jgi:GH18 family chitinase
MKQLRYLKFVLVLFLVLGAMPLVKAQFKVVGYIRPKANLVDDLTKVDLTKITHLNIAFINPDTNGVFKDASYLKEVVSYAHQYKVKVLMSCGGGSRQKYYGKLLADNRRAELVKNFIAFVKQYKLDGIDVDLEGDDIDDNYGSFITELREGLGKKKLLTAALAFYTRKRITDQALQQLDFINAMAYDKTGHWRPNDPGQHSPMSYALDHLNYWSKERNVAKEKVIIGVPFYGYGFGSLPQSDRSFKEMSWAGVVAKFPDALNQDEIALPNDGGNIYYNGMATIKEKTKLALNQAGGIMIWQLMHDSFDDKSLLKVIDDTIKEQAKASK